MPYTLKIPDGRDIKTYWKANWKSIIPWALLIIAAIVIYNLLFNSKKLPPKVKDTEVYIVNERVVDSLKAVINKATDSIRRQSIYIETMYSELASYRKNFRDNDKRLHEILNDRSYIPPNFDSIQIANWLNRKYGDSNSTKKTTTAPNGGR